MEEAFEPHITAQQVPVGVGGQVEQQLLHQAAVLDLKGGHVRLGYDTGDLHQALHPTIHLRAATQPVRQMTTKAQTGEIQCFTMCLL